VIDAIVDLIRAAGRRGTATLDAVVRAVGTNPVLDRIVDAQLDRVTRPLIVSVVDQVLALLEAEPARVQALIRGQRESMVDELVDQVRAGAEAGDAGVERLAARLFRRSGRRGSRPAPAPAPVPAPAPPTAPE
jgi:hypothetical protein